MLVKSVIASSLLRCEAGLSMDLLGKQTFQIYLSESGSYTYHGRHHLTQRRGGTSYGNLLVKNCQEGFSKVGTYIGGYRKSGMQRFAFTTAFITLNDASGVYAAPQICLLTPERN